MADLTSGGDPASGKVFMRQDFSRQNSLTPRRADAGRLSVDYAPGPRQNAFKAADRHTARVKFLRRAIVTGAVFAISVLTIVVAFNPFRHLKGEMSLAGVGIHGTTITMDAPKISGTQQGGGAYEVTAKTGVQQMATPSIVDLIGVDATISMADQSHTHVLADDGIYDNKLDTMALNGHVHIANANYVLNLKSAMIQFRDGIFSSQDRSTVDLKGGTVASDSMIIRDNGHSIVFSGHIASMFDAPSDDSNDATQDGGAVLSAAPSIDPDSAQNPSSEAQH